MLSEARSLAGFVALFLLSVALTIGLWVAVPAVFGGQGAVAITSASMAPGIQTGDVVVYTPHDGVGLGAGTVITFQPDDGGSPITHRITSVNEVDGTYITRGDANREDDSTPVRSDQVIGVGKQLIPWAGYPAYWYQRGDWLKIFLLVAAMIGVIWASRWGINPIRRKRMRPLQPNVREA